MRKTDSRHKVSNPTDYALEHKYREGRAKTLTPKMWGKLSLKSRHNLLKAGFVDVVVHEGKLIGVLPVGLSGDVSVSFHGKDDAVRRPLDGLKPQTEVGKGIQLFDVAVNEPTVANTTVGKIMSESGQVTWSHQVQPFRVRPANVTKYLSRFQELMAKRKKYRRERTDDHILRRSGRSILVPDSRFDAVYYRILTRECLEAWDGLLEAKLTNLKQRTRSGAPADKAIVMPVPPQVSYETGKGFKDPAYDEEAYEEKRKKDRRRDEEGGPRVRSGGDRARGFDKKMARLGVGVIAFSNTVHSADAVSGAVDVLVRINYGLLILGFIVLLAFFFEWLGSCAERPMRVERLRDVESNDPLLGTRGYGGGRTTNAVKYRGQGGRSKLRREPMPFPADAAAARRVSARLSDADKSAARFHAGRRINERRRNQPRPTDDEEEEKERSDDDQECLDLVVAGPVRDDPVDLPPPPHILVVQPPREPIITEPSDDGSDGNDDAISESTIESVQPVAVPCFANDLEVTELPCVSPEAWNKPPCSKCLFTRDELFKTVNGNLVFDSVYELASHDMGGPWCGPICVLTGLGRPLVAKQIRKQFAVNGVLYTCSTLRNVSKYAAMQGANVLFVVRRAQGVRYVMEEHNYNWPWVGLQFDEYGGGVAGVGHYTLLYAKHQASMVDLSGVDGFMSVHGRVHDRVFGPVYEGFKVRKVDHVVHTDDIDRRAIIDSRDPVSPKGQDKLEIWRITRGLFFRKFWKWGRRATTENTYVSVPCCTTDEEVVVSKCRLYEALRAVQSAFDSNGFELALNVVDRSHGINTQFVAAGAPVIQHTKAVARLVSRSVKPMRSVIQVRDQFNTPNDLCYVDPQSLVDISDNQLLGLKGYGASLGGPVPGLNFIEKFPRRIRVKTERVVASAPLGCIVTDDGPVGAGLIPVTDHAGIISCFSNRYIARCLAKRDDPLHKIFVHFSKIANRYLLEGLVVPPEPTLGESFRLMSRGKRSGTEVELLLDRYERYCDGRLTSSEEERFRRSALFCKLEDNSKLLDGDYFNKHRGITTMGDYESIIGSGIPLMSKLLYSGFASRFTIKECTPQEMITKIMDVQEGPHVVTDFSTYETTFDYQQRTILGQLLMDFAEKYSWPILGRSVPFVCTYGSITAKHVGMRCVIEALGSGFTTTALMGWCGNLNTALFGFAFRRLRDQGFSDDEIIDKLSNVDDHMDPFVVSLWHDLRAIMEGDDGLVRKNQTCPDIIERLGFKLSLSYEGTKPGDCDFLSSRWMDDKRYLNVGKYLCKFLWVRNVQKLSRGKQLYILRCMASSLYHMSPGHPVLMALVQFVGRLTSHTKPFKNYEKYLDEWKFPGIRTGFPSPEQLRVDETMRWPLAEGGAGFTAIGISDQLLLEKSISEGHLFIGNVLSGDEYVEKCVRSLKPQNELRGRANFNELLAALRVDPNTVWHD
jgi:hypothetical protein